MIKKLLLVAGLLATVPGFAGDAARSYITDERLAANPGLPFSNGVLVGDTLYVAGHLGLDPATGQAPADVKVEAQMVMDSVKKTVEKAGFSMNDLVSVTVYCTDLKLYDTFNATYRTYFNGQFPARAFIGAGSLLRGGHFEVQGVAVRPKAAKN
ncbi:MAG TPA: Rid family hydrolase [Steroidobacteraceae bacterium]|nr:Rid family hydrolase [Steroidobacteraceae bacterium]